MEQQDTQKLKREIKTPCKIKELESIILSIGHDGGWDNAVITTSNDSIIIEYEKHKIL